MIELHACYLTAWAVMLAKTIWGAGSQGDTAGSCSWTVAGWGPDAGVAAPAQQPVGVPMRFALPGSHSFQTGGALEQVR